MFPKGVSATQGRWIEIGCAGLKEKKKIKREREGWRAGQKGTRTRQRPWIPAEVCRSRVDGELRCMFEPRERGDLRESIHALSVAGGEPVRGVPWPAALELAGVG